MRRPALSLALCALLLLPFTLPAQELLTLRDAILKAGTDLAPERLKGLQWIEGEPAYSYVDGERLMRATPGKAMERPLVDLATLNALLPDSMALRGIPAVQWEAPARFRFWHRGGLYGFDLERGELQQRLALPKGAANVDLHAASGRVAFTLENDLYVAAPDQKPLRITTDGRDGIVNGQAVHRQEYGITKGTFWSPDGRQLAFYRMDETMVTSYQLEDVTSKPSIFNAIRYPMAGQRSHHVSVGVYDLERNTTSFLRTGEPLDQYLTNISWSADGRFVHVVHLDRKTENLRLVRYDAVAGEVLATLLTEHDGIYLEPEHPAHFLKTRPGQYIWWSERDGWQHLYLYDVKRGLVRQLTKGNWVVKDLLGMDPKESYVVVEGSGVIRKDDPSGARSTHLYRVDLASGKTTRLTEQPGTHHGSLSSDGSLLLDTWSSTKVPNSSEIIDVRSGKVLRTLLTASDPFNSRKVGTIELLSIPGERGDLLNARLIRPSFFDPKERYPVLIYVYNGPHVQLVNESFLGGASPWMLEAAERGYLVWTVDGHGSAYRGRDFEQAVHRQLGVVEVNDQLRGVEYLKQLPYVDGGRIGVHGWSFGGHMTTAMLLRHPGTFRVGVAGGPVMDWSRYEVMYTERYMDTPEENPEGYATTDLTKLAPALQEDLLLITGGQDDVVLPQHSYAFIKACVDAGVQVDLFNYPGHGHNVRGKDRLHLMEKVLRYMDQRLLLLR